MLTKQGSNKKRDNEATNSNTKRGYNSFKRSTSELSAIKLFKRLGGKIVAVVRMMSPRSSGKVNSSNKPLSDPPILINSDHRVEAIKDCINFINSSSSRLPRSNSGICALLRDNSTLVASRENSEYNLESNSTSKPSSCLLGLYLEFGHPKKRNSCQQILEGVAQMVSIPHWSSSYQRG
ncbi:hypothetical protein KY290_029352 [Solanum tuberosum]|uniref:Uncharacterized protein n=1 Tax=Solanum tuberosum TaxID=4113 RepID=A0ABQ7UKH2_SOLTU|nr:hypothetical protein KY284_029344 [Solanum tuberosum]KAH0750120.1 hypothetical protein KY290_029352 [Solanum tuberosum]